MTVKDAYDKVEKLPDRNVLVYCLEYEDEWEFYFSHRQLFPNECPEGGGIDVVNRITGEVTDLGTDGETTMERMKKPSRPLDVKQFPKGENVYQKQSLLERFLEKIFGNA